MDLQHKSTASRAKQSEHARYGLHGNMMYTCFKCKSLDQVWRFPFLTLSLCFIVLYCSVLQEPCVSIDFEFMFVFYFSLWTNAELYEIFFSGYGSCFIPSLLDYGLKVHVLLKACACKKELCNLTMSSYEISISNPLQKIPHVYRYTYKCHVP